MAKTDVAVKSSGALQGAAPAHLQKNAERQEGRGVSSRQEDNLVPLIYVLQALSPQLGRGPQKIDGAQIGDILLRNAPQPLVKGEDGIVFQPCHFDVAFVEWIPRDNGGGFVARHAAIPAEATKVTDPKNPNRVKWFMKNGNEIIETRYHTGFVITEEGPLPYVLPFTSSGHTVSKNWMFMMNSKMVNGKKCDSFTSYYRLRTKERSNAQGTWSVLEPSWEGWVPTEADIERGEALFNAFHSGEKKIDAEEAHGDMAAGDSDKM